MASVMVFVDDAIRGDLPGICIKTGQPASRSVLHKQTLGGIGAAPLLLFLGPPGWLALAILATWRREVLSVWLPYSDAALADEGPARRVRAGAFICAAISFSLAVAMSLSVGMFLIAGISLAVGIGANFVLYWKAPGVSLDGSRRWVTLSNVHPDFVASVERHRSTSPAR